MYRLEIGCREGDLIPDLTQTRFKQIHNRYVHNHYWITKGQKKEQRLVTHVNITNQYKIAVKILSDQSLWHTAAWLIFYRSLWWQAQTCVGVMSITSEQGDGKGEEARQRGWGLLVKTRVFTISVWHWHRRLYSYFTSPAASLSFLYAHTLRRLCVKWQWHDG